jgi:hypothetical protein
MRRRWIVAWPAAVAALVFLAAAPARGQVPAGTEFQANAYTTEVQARASVSSDASGNFVVVWHSRFQDGSGFGVFGRRYDATGTPLGVEFQVSSYTTSHQFFPSVSADSGGNFVAAWASVGQDGTGYGIFAQRHDASGTRLGVEFQVNSYTTADQGLPSVAVDASGSFVVVWQSYGQDGTGNGVFGQRYDATGTPQGGEQRVNTYTTGDQGLPSVAVDASGNFVVVWQSYTQDGSGYGVFARRYDATGMPQGSEFQVNSVTTYSQFSPSVASDGAGNFVVVWTSYGQDGSGAGVFRQRFDASGTPQGGELQVNTYTTSDQANPGVAADGAGHFRVAWESAGQDGSNLGIFGQVYDATGTPLGGEFQVNSYTTSVQTAPSVAADAAGDFVVVWDSDQQDGDALGVFGQRFEPDLIFADGFESGDLSAWSQSESGGGDLAASPGAALAGTATGLQAVVDDAGALYVRDDTAAGEGRYRARFFFDPHGFDPGEAEGHRRTRIFIAFDDSPVRRHVAVVLRRVSGQYAVQTRVRVDDNSQLDTGFFDVSDAPHFVELDWRQATDALSSDGSLEMWIDGVSVSTLTGLADSLRSVDFVRLGPQSLKGGAAGTLFFDEFESRRLGMIGP